jgi:dTDP-4-amino-4,6-dideoxygalactose transaminase
VLLFDDAKKRNELFTKIGSCGLGVSIVYLNAICDYSYLKEGIVYDDCGSARDFSKRQLTLSTNIFLNNKDAEFITRSIKEVLSA